MSTRTDTEWAVINIDDGEYLIVDGDRRAVAIVDPQETRRGQPARKDAAELARLMAAAPKLLAALEAARAVIAKVQANEWVGPVEAVIALDAITGAIREATGEVAADAHA